ncbi:MAG: hypothetical protein Q9166_004694 [cf. Caloplaca sp. 2 TL-2023]
MTGWYETYFDCLRGGRFSKHIDDMHKRYGNVVRINPWELHICDPTFFDQFYTSSSKLDKDPWYYNFAGIPRSTFATGSWVLHRQRRTAISRAFATSTITSKTIEGRVESLIKRLRPCRKNTNPEVKVIRMSNMFWMLASDVATGCMMPNGTDYMTLPDKAPHYARMFKTLAKVALWNRHFPTLFHLLSCLPRCLANKTAQPFVEVLRMQDAILYQIQHTPVSESKHTTLPRYLQYSKLSILDKHPTRLLEEITMIIGAGTEAVGAALSITTYYILSYPACLTRLRSELQKAAQHHETVQRSQEIQHHTSSTSEIVILPYAILQHHCPYLIACIKEGLRLSKESNRMPRISSIPTTYGDTLIPAGTVISMSLRDVHLHHSIFPSPHTFDPERWFGSSAVELENFLVPFGKGSRSCPGRAIAMEELVVGVGNLFANVGMQMWDTIEGDIIAAHDFFSGAGGEREGGLKIVLK